MRSLVDEDRVLVSGRGLRVEARLEVGFMHNWISGPLSFLRLDGT